MLRKQDITAGKWYVNNYRTVAREVVSTDKQTVKFYTYHLDTGNSCDSPSECTKQNFIRWADHEASTTEIDSVYSLR
ncbi:MAG: hypothetical protein ABI904_13345 [Chloroflexota bacterium]